MAQLLVRNLEEDTVQQLKARAKENHRSLQAEVQLILENAAKVKSSGFWERAKQTRMKIQARDGVISDSSADIRADRDA